MLAVESIDLISLLTHITSARPMPLKLQRGRSDFASERIFELLITLSVLVGANQACPCLSSQILPDSFFFCILVYIPGSTFGWPTVFTWQFILLSITLAGLHYASRKDCNRWGTRKNSQWYKSISAMHARVLENTHGKHHQWDRLGDVNDERHFLTLSILVYSTGKILEPPMGHGGGFIISYGTWFTNQGLRCLPGQLEKDRSLVFKLLFFLPPHTNFFWSLNSSSLWDPRIQIGPWLWDVRARVICRDAYAAKTKRSSSQL